MSYRSQPNSQWFLNGQPSKLEVGKEGLSKQGDLYELERQAFEFFGRSEINRDMKKII